MGLTWSKSALNFRNSSSEYRSKRVMSRPFSSVILHPYALTKHKRYSSPIHGSHGLTSNVCTNSNTSVLLLKNTSGSLHPFNPWPITSTILLHISSQSSSTSLWVRKSGIVSSTWASMMKKPTSSCIKRGRVLTSVEGVVDNREVRMRVACVWIGVSCEHKYSCHKILPFDLLGSYAAAQASGPGPRRCIYNDKGV